MSWLNTNIAIVSLFLTQFVMMCSIFAGIFISLNNSRHLREKASKADVEKVEHLVNGKTAKLEKLIEEKAFKAGVAEEKANPS